MIKMSFSNNLRK